MTKMSLNENKAVTLDGSGNGTLRMIPFSGMETWLPEVVRVKCSSAASEASCKIYVGPSATDPYFVDGTLSGSTGDSTDQVSGYRVDTNGFSLWAVWAGGDAGAQATMRVNGISVLP